MLALFKLRNPRLFLLGDAISSFGSSGLWLAMAILVQDLTGSPSQAGLVMFAFSLGSLLLPLSGLLVDRVRRRPLLIVVNLATPLWLAPLMFVHNTDQVWVVYLVMFGYGVSGSINGPAQSALVPALVPEELLGEANAATQTIRGLLRIASPVAGAGLYAWAGAGVVVTLDIATFLVAALALAAIKVTESRPQPTQSHWLADVSAGVRFLARTTILRHLMLAVGLAMLAIGFYESLGFAIVTVGLGHTPSYVGVLGTLMGVGTVAGGAISAAVLRRTGDFRLVAVGLAICGSCSLLLMSSLDLVVLAGMLLLGICVTWIVVGTTVAIQRSTPSELLGRCFAAFELSVTGPQTASMALGAALIAQVNYRYLLVAIAVMGLSTAGYLATRRVPPMDSGESDRQEPAEVEPPNLGTSPAL